jgi:hypothetical protein
MRIVIECFGWEFGGDQIGEKYAQMRKMGGELIIWKAPRKSYGSVENN